MTRETGVQKITMVLCALALFGAGYYVGHATVASNAGVLDLASTTPPQGIQVNFGTFWDVWTLINDRFIDASSTDAQTKVYGAISGLVNSLDDPYSVFLPPQDASSFNDMIAGSFGGVGMEVGKRDGALTVISPLKGSPAELAGVRAGDIIVEINGTSTAEMSIDDAVELIRGPIGTAVHLTLSREGASEFLEKKIVRQSIDIPALDTTARPDGIFVLSLYNFDATATRKVRDALSQFVASGDRKLILDLRGNPGGFLDAAVDIAGYFLPEGAVVVKEKTDQGHSEQTYRSVGYTLLPKGIAVVVLVDGGSASASEILAGALQEHGAATLVGEKTFGKGSVQELIPVTPETSLKLTVGKWFTPSGKSISDNGLTPDVVVPFSDADAAAGKDPQMEKAVKLLNGH